MSTLMSKRALSGWVLLGLLSGSTAWADAPDKKTERTWKAKCASCHGATGKGDTEQGQKQKVRDMTSAAFQKDVTDEAIKKSLLEGVKREHDGVKQEMESFKDTLKPEQMDALVKYVRALGGGK
jgi:mono/diheme cytochrome c family protein